MQGFIIKLNRVKDEDLIVTIISETNLTTLYRFYGARHGPINLGFKIDYESEASLKSSVSRMRDVIHLGFSWLSDYNRLRIWQQFISLFHPHLQHSEEIGSFYFTLIDQAAQQWNEQNPKRLAIEAYIQILKHEGRLHSEPICFFCDEPILDNIALIRAFLPAHQECSHTLSINAKGLSWLYAHHSTLFLDDTEIERLWTILCEGF
jgi:hypothetical protein